MPDRIVRTIDGKRGGFLVITSIITTILGYSHLVYTSATRDLVFSGAEWLTTESAGVVIIVISAIALPLGLFSKLLPSWCESLAFVLLSAVTASLAAIHLVAWLFQVSPNSWVSMVIYSFFALSITHASNWDNPRKTTHELVDEARRTRTS